MKAFLLALSFIGLGSSAFASPARIFCKDSNGKVQKIELTESSSSYFAEVGDMEVFVSKPAALTILIQYCPANDDVEGCVQAVGTGSVQLNRGYSNSKSLACGFTKSSLEDL